MTVKFKYFAFFAAALLCVGLRAQTNAFYDRAYWKASPDIAKVEQDIAAGNSPSQLNANGFDATVFAILENAPDATIKHLFLKPGNDVNKITHDGRTYIFWAAYKGNTALMEYLQQHGAKTDIVEDHGYTIMNFAASTGQANTKVYDLCLKFGANLNKDLDHDGANALLLAAPYDKDLSLINYFTSKGLDLKSRDANGNGILDYVARNGNRELMETLLKKGMRFTDNAMIMASQGTRSNVNTLETYQFLESKGVKPDAKGVNGENALHAIVRKDTQIEVIRHFLSKGLDVNQATKEGNTVFMNAASNADVAVLELLSGKLANIEAVNAKGQSALFLAVQYNSPAAVACLLEKGAGVNAADADGNNLGYYLVQSYSAKKAEDFDAKLKLLSQKGFNIAAPQKNGNTLYHFAVARNDDALLKRCSGFGIDVNARNKEGMTALHKAAMTSKNDAILKYLVSIGAQKQLTTDMDETAYDLASENEALAKNKISIDFLKA